MAFFFINGKSHFFQSKKSCNEMELSAGSEENKIIHYRCFIKLEITEQVTEFIFYGFFLNNQSTISL